MKHPKAEYLKFWMNLTYSMSEISKRPELGQFNIIFHTPQLSDIYGSTHVHLMVLTDIPYITDSTNYGLMYKMQK